MSECTCGSGAFSGGCCCGSVTNIKGGIHPDSILSVSRDLFLDQPTLIARTHASDFLIQEPAHIVGIEASLVSVRRDDQAVNVAKQLLEPDSNAQANIAAATPVTVSLYTVAGYAVGDLDLGGFAPANATIQDRRYFATASLTAGLPTWTASPDIFGFFADGGIFVELNSPTNDYGVRLIVRYVPRLQFTPAYHDPLAVMQHYWKCSRGETEFLEGFYGGTSGDFRTSAQTDTTAAAGSADGSVFGSNQDTEPPAPSPPSWII